MTLLAYKNNPHLAKRYVELNRIVRCEYALNIYGQPCAWEMSGETTGFPTPYRTVREAKTAVAAGNALLETLNA